MFKDYDNGLGNYIKSIFSYDVINVDKETAFEMYSKHNNQKKVNFPFISYSMTGDIGLDVDKYNSVIHRVGIVIENNHTTKLVTRNRAIPITHSYTIDLWTQEKDSLNSLQRTFWIAVLDNPIVSVFSKETNLIYRVPLYIEGSSNEIINQAEERAGFFNTTINVSLSLWIRMPRETKSIAKAIVKYIESPENYILMVREYS